jgi:hypothetical protein
MPRGRKDLFPGFVIQLPRLDGWRLDRGTSSAKRWTRCVDPDPDVKAPEAEVAQKERS